MALYLIWEICSHQNVVRLRVHCVARCMSAGRSCRTQSHPPPRPTLPWQVSERVRDEVCGWHQAQGKIFV